MASPAEIARRYFAALLAHDLDAALAGWAPGAIDRLVGAQDLVAPGGVREYFGSVFEAFPDFELVSRVAWAGHADPVSEDVKAQLRVAAAASL